MLVEGLPSRNRSRLLNLLSSLNRQVSSPIVTNAFKRMQADLEYRLSPKERVSIGKGIKIRRGQSIEFYAYIDGKDRTTTIKNDGQTPSQLHNLRIDWMSRLEKENAMAKTSGVPVKHYNITFREVLDELVERGLMYRIREGRYSSQQDDRIGYASPIARLLEDFANTPFIQLTADLLADHAQRRLANGASIATVNKSFSALRCVKRLALISNPSKGWKRLITHEVASLIAPKGMDIAVSMPYMDTDNDRENTEGVYIPPPIRDLMFAKATIGAKVNRLLYHILWDLITGQRRGELLRQLVENIDFLMWLIYVRIQDSKSRYWRKTCRTRKSHEGPKKRRVLMLSGLADIITNCAEAYGHIVERNECGVPVRILGSGYLFGEDGAAVDANPVRESTRLTDFFAAWFDREILPELPAMAERGEIKSEHIRSYNFKDIRCSVWNDMQQTWRGHPLTLDEHFDHTKAVRKNYERNPGTDYEHPEMWRT